ncbi:MAG: MFS transporter [Promethearchaeota archaeon]
MSYVKINLLVYFYAYFAAQLIFTYIHVYLPIYLYNTLNIDRTQLAFIQIFSYSAFFAKPLISIYFDRDNARKKFFLIISTIFICLGFSMTLFGAEILIALGLFMAITFAFLSVMDVVIDKSIVQSAESEREKSEGTLIMLMGSFAGAFCGNIFALMVFTDFSSKTQWLSFFSIGISIIFPMIIISLLFKDKRLSLEKFQNQNVKLTDSINKKAILILSIFILLAYGDKLYEYPLEPWFVNKYAEGNTAIFIFYSLLMIMVNALSQIIAAIISDKFNRKKIVIYSCAGIGVCQIVAPFLDLTGFLLIVAVMQFFAAFALVNAYCLMITYSTKQVLPFQIISCFAVLAQVIFVPLGTYMSGIMATEYIIIIAGILSIVSAMVLILL